MYIDPKYHDTMQPSLVSHNCYGDLQARFRKQGTRNYSAHLSAGFAMGYMEKIGGIVSVIVDLFIHSNASAAG